MRITFDNFAIAKFLRCAQGACVGVLWCGKDWFKQSSVYNPIRFIDLCPSQHCYDYSPSSTQASTVTTNPNVEYFLHFGTKEASAIPLLGTILSEFAEVLTQRGGAVYKEFSVVLNTQKWGQKPSCDSAIRVISSTSHKRPVILYEYKPTVDTRSLKVNHDHLMELFLQGCYCLWQYQLQCIVHSLTGSNFRVSSTLWLS